MHVIGTAGHVDHGKSSLVRALTGVDPDTLSEEKRRGLTIDLGFAWVELPSGEEAGVIDVPGHERFIRNMLAGAGGITICLFVVAANEGWSRQSTEHLAIVDLLGINEGVAALTKSDLVAPSELDRVEAIVRERLRGTSLDGIPIVRCSSATGEGIEDLRAVLDEVVRATPPSADTGKPRLWVDRVFTIAGSGTVVTGTLAGGSLAAGDLIQILPAGHEGRVRAIQTHKNEVTRAMPGTRVALNLAGLGRARPDRGDAIVAPGTWRATARVDVSLQALGSDQRGPGIATSDRPNHLLYAGSAESVARVKVIGAESIAEGGTGWAQIELRDPLPLARADRFVLRDAGRATTAGGGLVVDPFPTPARRRDDDARVHRLERLAAAGTAEEAAVALIQTEGMVHARELALRAGAAVVPSDAVRLGPLIASPTEARRLAALVQEELTEHHRAFPLQAGAPRERVRSVTGLEPDAFDALLATIDEAQTDGAVVRLTTHAVSLTADQQRERDRLVETIESAGFAPPLATELDADASLLDALVAGGDLVRIGGFYLTTAQTEEARVRIRDLIATEGPATVARIRDALETTRKYAVPLCEWLDATGVTRRRGDVRILV